MSAPQRDRAAQQLARQRRRAAARARKREAARPPAQRHERGASGRAASGRTAVRPEPPGPGPKESAPTEPEPTEPAGEGPEGSGSGEPGTSGAAAEPPPAADAPAGDTAPDADAHPARGSGHDAGHGSGHGSDARAAFEALYERHVHALTRQTYLLTGRRRLAEWAVGRAFHTAWERWPEVAVDRDPAGWVRAAAHEQALSPWHWLRPRLGAEEAYPGLPEDGVILEALLSLPTVYRRVLLLHDGVGLGLAETAAETEASTPATASRLRHAREALAARLPELAAADVEARGPLVSRLLHRLAAAQPVHSAPARDVRRSSDRLTFGRTAAACVLTALVVTATSVGVATAESDKLLPTSLPTALRHFTE
ncbi:MULTISPECIES: RNA polymerase sigma factor [unclassified Streptomyces]|uniref:RNA polymerase sigma factor n=1 Tax=unclassified Streptomyces TaxID=2593676 RepID=UPI0022B70445|nr:MULTISPECIES: sigma factor-like helix-turn-helix DNA-binding protein [unclassified Streptomyces]MCZ7417086.1 sigma factor-like helix-turn-helix DNA-binding protein [Streptomyces sp. WMMC897]MCZ7433086.1 sigma factor-like helix-turn-helix DNA-binding protein [Streptomyces sp. WMMC1477]